MQTIPEPVPQVQVVAAAADVRFQSTTTAIIVGRKGDTSLADVLKRQPGITVDAGISTPVRTSRATRRCAGSWR
jgi:hypothetical protein